MINIQKKINYIIVKKNIILFHNKIQLIEVHNSYTKIYILNPDQNLNQFINNNFSFILISNNSKFNETYLQDTIHNIFILKDNEKQKMNYNEDINIEINDNIQYVNFTSKDLFKIHIYKILHKLHTHLKIKKLRLNYNGKINYKFNFNYNNFTKNTIHYEYLNKKKNIEVVKKIIYKKKNKIEFKNFEIINLLQEYKNKCQKQSEIIHSVYQNNLEIKYKLETKIKFIKNNYNNLNLIELKMEPNYIHNLFQNKIIEEYNFIKSFKEKKKSLILLKPENFLNKTQKQFENISLDNIQINLNIEIINKSNQINDICEKIKFNKKKFENIKINDFLIHNKEKKINYKIKFKNSITISLSKQKIDKIKFQKNIKNKFHKKKLEFFKKIKLLTLQNIKINKISLENIEIKLLNEKEIKFNVQKLIHFKFKCKKISPNVQHKLKKKKFNDKILNYKINLKIECNQKHLKIKSIQKKIKLNEYKPIQIKLIKNHCFQINYLHKNINNITKQLFHKNDLNSSILDNHNNFINYFTNINFTPYKIMMQNQLHKEYDLNQHKININNYKLIIIHRFLKNLEYRKKEIFDFIKLQYNNINISYIKKDFCYNDLNEILLNLENIFDINTYKIYIYDNNLIQKIKNNIQNFIKDIIQNNDNIENIYKDYVIKVFEDFNLIKNKELNNSNKNFMIFNNIKKKNKNRIEQNDLKRRLKKINNNNNVFIF